MNSALPTIAKIGYGGAASKHVPIFNHPNAGKVAAGQSSRRIKIDCKAGGRRETFKNFTCEFIE